MILVEVFWVVTPCIVVVGYLEDGGSKFLRHVGILHSTAGRHNPEDLDLDQ
jgi:hypothetical protein